MCFLSPAFLNGLRLGLCLSAVVVSMTLGNYGQGCFWVMMTCLSIYGHWLETAADKQP